MPSLTPASEGTETLTPLAEGTLTAAVAVEGVETVVALVELVPVPEQFFPGLLPSLGLFPGTDGPYPDDNETIPGIEGVTLTPLPAATLTLTPEVED